MPFLFFTLSKDPILSDKKSIARAPARYVVDGPKVQYDAHAVGKDRLEVCIVEG